MFSPKTVLNVPIQARLSLISDIIRDRDLFMDFTEVSLTDPFMALFIATERESCAK